MIQQGDTLTFNDVMPEVLAWHLFWKPYKSDDRQLIPPDEMIVTMGHEDKWFPAFRREAEAAGGYMVRGITNESWIIAVGESSIQIASDDYETGKYHARGRGPYFKDGWPEFRWTCRWIGRKTTSDSPGDLTVACRPRRIIQAIRSMG